MRYAEYGAYKTIMPCDTSHVVAGTDTETARTERTTKEISEKHGAQSTEIEAGTNLEEYPTHIQH